MNNQVLIAAAGYTGSRSAGQVPGLAPLPVVPSRKSKMQRVQSEP